MSVIIAAALAYLAVPVDDHPHYHVPLHRDVTTRKDEGILFQTV
jgi:hypothetical protein